jgi:GntR family transcriptional regulator / MocR family aminotransferase
VDLAIKFTAGVTLRRQLEQALRVAIRSGRLAPGSLLPSSRDLAEELAVSRGVVVDSYSQLAAEGYLSARRGSGTASRCCPNSPGRPSGGSLVRPRGSGTT